MTAITLLLTPSQLASIRGTSINDIFDQLHSNAIPYLITDEGIKIQVTYIWTTKQ